MINMNRYEHENVNNEIAPHVKIGVFVLVYLSCLDPLFFSGETLEKFWWSRVCIGLAGLALIRLNQQGINLWQFTIWGPCYIAQIFYIYLYHQVDDNNSPSVLIANALLLSLNSLYFYRFNKTFNRMMISYAALFILSLIMGASVFLVTNMFVCFFIIFFLQKSYNKSFLHNLIVKFNNMKMIVPKKIATELILTNKDIKTENVFSPKKKYAVVLSADWRNFQETVSNRLSIEETNNLFNSYYNLCFDALEKIDPEGNYFSEAIGDELFVVFFDEDDNEDIVNERALRFSEFMTTELQNQLYLQSNIYLLFDIGLANTGDEKALIGLMGDIKRKATILGPVAGKAKRLEGCAKKIRNDKRLQIIKDLEGSDLDSLIHISFLLRFISARHPSIIMSYELGEWAKKNNKTSFRGGLSEVISREKDYFGVKAYYWQDRRIDHDRQLENQFLPLLERIKDEKLQDRIIELLSINNLNKNEKECLDIIINSMGLSAISDLKLWFKEQEALAKPMKIDEKAS